MSALIEQKLNVKAWAEQNSRYLMIILGVLVSLPAISMDIYVPSLPQMASYFQVGSGYVQATLASFLMGVAVSILPYGILSDHDGRKRILIIGLSIYLLATVMCLLAETIYFMIAARFAQGVGASVCTVSAFAIARDLYEGQILTRKIGFISSILGSAPVIAPFIGSMVANTLGWRANFALLFLMATALLGVIISFVYETNTTIKSERVIFMEKWLIFKNNYFTKDTAEYLFVIASIFACFFVYLCSVPFIYQSQFHFSLAITGLLMGINAMAFILGGVCVSKLWWRYHRRAVVMVHLGLMIIMNLILFLLSYEIAMSAVFGFVIIMFFNTLFISIVITTATAHVLDKNKTQAGFSTSVIGLLRFGLAALFTVASSVLRLDNMLAMAMFFLLIAIISFSCMGLTSRRFIE